MMAQYHKARKISGSPDYCDSLMSELQHAKTHTDTILHSDGRSVPLHSAILSSCSQVLADLLACSDDTKTLLVPGLSAVLCDFVSLVYTGLAPNLTALETEQLSSLCKELGMDTSVSDNGIEKVTKANSGQKHLVLESNIHSYISNESFVLRMPVSRVDHSQKTVNTDHVFEGFKGRVQDEYNESPVGPYEGPYDQDPTVPLFAQLSKSRITFDQYTNFIHPEKIKCKIFKLKQNAGNIDDLDRIKLIEICKNSSDMFVEPDNDEKTFYTCKNKFCVIPCPCQLCTSTEGQCPEHLVKHMDLFHEKEHAISVRSTELSCSKENFFMRSYVLKYPGIPKSCVRCSSDLLNHKSFHIKFHWTCKFCKLYQYKLYPKSVKELHEREVKEKTWYKSVCPHCDKRFTVPYQRKKHIESEHEGKNKLKCDECTEMFQCKQSLEYHILSKHTENAPLHNCNMCTQSFPAKVTLDNHIKYKHSDLRKFKCKKCGSMFKQRKNLNQHLLNVHGTNPRKEDYWQDLQRKISNCESCGEKFTRKTDLNAHIKAKHADNNTFSCDHCSTKFRYKKNLTRHKLENHGGDEKKYECPDCGKLFNQKSNMERHRLTHEIS